MTDRRGGVMTDETRDEIVRLARKGWGADQILDSLHKACPSGQQRWWTGEQVQHVIDEADREVERMLTPTVPATNREDVPQDTDAIGRIAKWLDDAREAGYGSRDIVEMLVGSAWTAMTGQAGNPPTDRDMGDEMADQLDQMAEGLCSCGDREHPCVVHPDRMAP